MITEEDNCCILRLKNMNTPVSAIQLARHINGYIKRQLDAKPIPYFKESGV